MVRADEEARSRAFWAKEERLARRRVALNRSLAGNAASAKAVRDGWEPVILAKLEARLIERNEDE